MMHGVQNVQNLRKKKYLTKLHFAKFVQTPIHVTLWTFTSRLHLFLPYCPSQFHDTYFPQQ